MTRCARKKQQNWQEPKKKTCAGSGQFILSEHQEQPTTACVLWSMSCPPAAAHRQLCMRLRQSDRVTAARSWAEGRGTLGSGDEVMRCLAFYSSFFCSFFWKQTGKMESTASTPSTAREFQDTASPAVVSLYSVVPALIATKDGGATPVNEPGWIQVSQWTTNDTKN